MGILDAPGFSPASSGDTDRSTVPPEVVEWRDPTTGGWRWFDPVSGKTYRLMEEGGPWVEVTPDYRPAASGNPAEWTPVDRARSVLGKKGGATFDELTKALTDLVFWVFRNVEEPGGRLE